MASAPKNNTTMADGWFQVLNGKVVFITGAAGGIGSIICQTCVLQGARVVAADVNKAGVDQVLTQILAENERKTDQLMSLELDITNEQAIGQAVQTVVSKWGTIDVLINTCVPYISIENEQFITDLLVGAYAFGQVDNMSIEAWTRTYKINVLGYALLVKHISPIMKQQRAGSIVQFGSISGVVGQPSFLSYAADKAAVIQMTKNLAVDLGPYNIRCNSISPGLVVTPPVVALATQLGLSVEDFSQNIIKDQCFKRTASPQEMANLAVFLASDLCPFITGSNVIADGGYTTV